MRIGIITDETDTELVGFGTYTLNIVKNILNLDKENEYFLVHRKKENHKIYSQANEIIIPSGPFPLSTVRNFVTLPLKLKKYDLDIVHHTSSVGPLAFKQIWPTKKGKTIQTLHDITPIFYPESFETTVRIAFKYLIPRIVKNVDKILAVSEHSKNDISKHFKIPSEKIEVAYDAINPIFKLLNKNKCKESLKRYGIKDNFILCVSTLEAKKNIPTALKAYALLKKKRIKHKFVLVGRKGYGHEKIFETIK